jgi:hypothetical protein
MSQQNLFKVLNKPICWEFPQVSTRQIASFLHDNDKSWLARIASSLIAKFQRDSASSQGSINALSIMLPRSTRNENFRGKSQLSRSHLSCSSSTFSPPFRMNSHQSKLPVSTNLCFDRNSRVASFSENIRAPADSQKLHLNAKT